MLGMLLELDELEADGMEGILALDELWLVDSQASSNPLIPTNSRLRPSVGQNSARRVLALAGNLLCLCLAVIIFSLVSRLQNPALVNSAAF